MLLPLELSLICHVTHRDIVLTSFSSVVRSFPFAKMCVCVCDMCHFIMYTNCVRRSWDNEIVLCEKNTKRVKICEWFSNGIRCLSLDSIYILPFAMSYPFVDVTLFFVRLAFFSIFVCVDSTDTFWVNWICCLAGVSSMRCKHISKCENTHWYRIASIHEKKPAAATTTGTAAAEAQSNTIVCFHFPSKAKFNGMFTVDMCGGIACFVSSTLSLCLPSVSFSLSITPAYPRCNEHRIGSYTRINCCVSIFFHDFSFVFIYGIKVNEFSGCAITEYHVYNVIMGCLSTHETALSTLSLSPRSFFIFERFCFFQ